MKHRGGEQWLYLAPALIIVTFFLIYPTLVTIYQSFFSFSGIYPKNFVGFLNYNRAFSDQSVLIALRNNLLWIVLMTSVAVGFGLLLAVLFDRVRYEATAKSVIFLPMAISYTAASVIWRFVYAYRPPGFPQIGLLNALLVNMGRFVAQPPVQRPLQVLLALLAAVGLLLFLIGLTRGSWEAIRGWHEGHRLDFVGVSIVAGLALLAAAYLAQGIGAAKPGSWTYLFIPFAPWQLLVGLGGGLLLLVALRDQLWGPPLLPVLLIALLLRFVLSQAGFQPEAWLINRPWINNLALIVTGIWVWTGFCMVLLSAAYKGIPRELLDAARIDGANEWQVFWSITIPFMKPTIAVVTTTIIIFVLKIFDIVYVMTNGNYDTEVIANLMVKTMYQFFDFGRASAIAVILLLLIIPFIVINIRQLRAQEAVR